MAGVPPSRGELDDFLVRRLRTRKQIRDSLASSIICKSKETPDGPQDISNHFICHSAVTNAWKETKAVYDALYPAILSAKVEECIRDNLLVWLSILVYIQEDTYLDQFSDHFLTGDNKLSRTDEELPLKDHEIPHFSPFSRRAFLQEQYLFNPVRLCDI